MSFLCIWFLCGIIAGIAIRWLDWKRTGEFDLLSVVEVIVFAYLGMLRLSLAFVLLKEYLKEKNERP